MINALKKLGPGLLFAGAAIGVSHLVQSTRAGADFGFSLLWVLILSNIIKYPFFLFGPKYAMATGETLLHGYKKMNTSVLVIYFILSIITMFTIQTAVTIVTAGLAIELFGISSNITTWAVIITVLCLFIIIIGSPIALIYRSSAESDVHYRYHYYSMPNSIHYYITPSASPS